jgi:hypothetical protein
VAAGLALVLLSGSLGALLGTVPFSERGPAAEESAWVSAFTASDPELRGLAAEVARLEELLARHRQELGTGTAQVLEKNLQVMDQAIRESHAALRANPGNEFLEEHLARAFRAKAEYLRETAPLVSPAT